MRGERVCEGEEIREKQVAIDCFSWPAAKGEERESCLKLE